MAGPDRIRYGEALEVEGLRAFRKGLRSIDANLAKGIAKKSKTIADELIVQPARSKAASLHVRNLAGGMTHPGHEVVSAIRASGNQREAAVLFGKASVPQALGMEFGSTGQKTSRNKRPSPQFAAWRGNKEEAGYFLWPTIRDAMPAAEQAYIQMIEDIAGEAFPD